MTASQLRPLSQRHKLSRAQSESQWSMLKLIMKGHLLSKEANISKATFAVMGPLAVPMTFLALMGFVFKVESTSKRTHLCYIVAKSGMVQSKKIMPCPACGPCLLYPLSFLA